MRLKPAPVIGLDGKFITDWSDWQPADTAPKNRSIMLAYGAEDFPDTSQGVRIGDKFFIPVLVLIPEQIWRGKVAREAIFAFKEYEVSPVHYWAERPTAPSQT
jgi:hypothetical protein